MSKPIQQCRTASEVIGRASLGTSTTEHLVFDEDTGAILNPELHGLKLLGPLDSPDPEIHFADVYTGTARSAPRGSARE